MKRFYINVIDEAIKLAAQDAERLLLPDSPMMKELREKNDWRYSSGTGEEVYQKIVNCDLIAPVYNYRPWNPFSKVLGYTDGKAIYINNRKKFSHADLVGLLAHEWLHFGPKFQHGNNYKTQDKVLYSVNYFVSENIGKWL